MHIHFGNCPGVFNESARMQARCYAPAVRTAAPRAVAHRFRFASIIRFRPAALNFRFGFLACFIGAVTPDSLRIAAQRFRCASAILLRASALILLRLRGARLGVLAPALAPFWGNMARNSRICSSSRLFWASKPWMAALIKSLFSLCGILRLSVRPII